MDRLKALSIFKAVADHGSFVGAANALDLSCPAVTRSVQDMEALLGVRLLHRTTRRVSVTPVGEEVLERVNVLLQSYDDLALVGRANASEPVGTVRLAAPAQFGRRYLGTVLASFRSRFPRVTVELLLYESSTEWFGEDADLAIYREEDLRPSMISRRLVDVELGLYAAPSYVDRKGDPHQPSELGEHDCLTTGSAKSGASWSFLDAAGAAHQSPVLKGALHANQLEVLADAAVHGAGVAMLPAFVVEGSMARGELQRVMGDWQVAPMSMSIAYTSRNNQPPSVRKLIEHLIDSLGQQHDAAVVPTLRLVARDSIDLLDGSALPTMPQDVRRGGHVPALAA